MDGSCKQLIGEVRDPIPYKPGQPVQIDHEYVINGVAEIFMAVVQLAGKRHEAVTKRHTKKDWPMQIKQILDERYPEAIKVGLIMDNLNTHNIASLYDSSLQIRNWKKKQVFVIAVKNNYCFCRTLPSW
ncbi:transposase, partial [Desulfatiglans anilini]|uniref:transposase n=1 Tax=Desulfatiglans anilini TaxID=90728 RepID=UPI001ABFC9BF